MATPKNRTPEAGSGNQARRRIARRSNRIATRWASAQRAFSRLHARLYRISGGRFLAHWFDRAPVLVLETTGRRSGRRRRTPVLYLREGESFVVLAANAGADRTPAWWLNLKASGEGVAEVGRRRLRVRPRLLEGEERERLWRSFVGMYPQARDYATFTERELPLVALDPLS